jgi:hypothetical protein
MKLFSPCIETITGLKRPVSAFIKEPPLRIDYAFDGPPVLLPDGLCLARHFSEVTDEVPETLRNKRQNPGPLASDPSIFRRTSILTNMLVQKITLNPLKYASSKNYIFFLAIIWKTNQKAYLQYWGAFLTRKNKFLKISSIKTICIENGRK